MTQQKPTICKFNRSLHCPLPVRQTYRGEGFFVTSCPLTDPSFWCRIATWIEPAAPRAMWPKSITELPEPDGLNKPERLAQTALCFRRRGARKRILRFLRTRRMTKRLCREIIEAYVVWQHIRKADNERK